MPSLTCIHCEKPYPVPIGEFPVAMCRECSIAQFMAWEADKELRSLPRHTEARTLSAIATDIVQHWERVHFAAQPYLNAMLTMDGIGDTYGAESGRSVVLYFLSNAVTWRGPHAKRVKAELKAMLKE